MSELLPGGGITHFVTGFKLNGMEDGYKDCERIGFFEIGYSAFIGSETKTYMMFRKV